MNRFARRVFTVAGIYGLIVMTPQYFLADRISRDTPPAITHLEYFYGFIGLAVAWQFVFLLIGRDPERYRPLMIPAVLEKLAFGVPAIILFAQDRLPGSVLFFGLLDLALGALFVAAWRATAGAPDAVQTLGTRQARA
ncbi:MAG TPA: hypothetical protein VFW03_00135 [Gemmatimonadaceae bacterium]|nr:hypothetical protein [Gemmatimonadaceae bacterium]